MGFVEAPRIGVLSGLFTFAGRGGTATGAVFTVSVELYSCFGLHPAPGTRAANRGMRRRDRDRMTGSG